jgi:hypothetical protein
VATSLYQHEPTLPYNGVIADTDALEKWVVEVAVPAAAM